ncbi:MAG: hypothetical protein ACXAE3_04165 [Candidatus Kariarchaeaceae archaeon]|jgi:hypothetical protein
MSQLSPTKRYVIIFPIITSVLIFASVAGIIGNGVLLADVNTNRSFTIENLEIGEVADKQITIPSDFQDPQIRIDLTRTDLANLNDLNNLKISIYLSERPLPGSIDNQTEFLDSSYYDDDIIDEGEQISETDSFFLASNPDTLYFIFVNEGDETVSFRVNAFISSSQGAGLTNSGRILGIIFSSLLTAAFMAASIYLWLEIFEKIPVRFLTQKLEERLAELQTKALTWEVVVSAGATVLIILGYSQILIGQGTGNIGIAILGYVLVYYNFNKRTKMEQSMLRIISTEKQISLERLASTIEESQEDVKKTLLDAILYSEFPAEFDFKTNMVSYNPSGQTRPQEMYDQQEPVQEASFHVASTEVQTRVIEDESAPARPKPKCAYCDVEAINVNAQFCHNCGASMSSAK